MAEKGPLPTVGAKAHTSAVKISGGRVRPSNYAEMSRLASMDAHPHKVTKGPSKIATGTGPNRIYSQSAPLENNTSTSSTGQSNASRAASSKVDSPVPAAPPQAKILQEYTLRVPKTNVKPISLMRFNGPLNVDVAKWTSVKMQREDNTRHQKVNNNMVEDESPKFGAGSEYGREAREEARRRKYGGNKKKINKEDQPWLLKLGDKINRRYKGIRDGGLTQNASYFIFTQAADGAFEVFPVQQWYNFSLIQSYKCLSAEEAEEEFGRRNKIMNYFSLMVKKRMQIEDEGDDGEKSGGKTAGKKSASSSLKVSEMDDWEDSDKEEDSDSDAKDDKDNNNKKKKKPGLNKKKKKKKDSDDEAFEDSDDGDGEGRELDYISDTSETEDEEEADKKNDQKGVDEAPSEEESSEEENKEVKEEEKDDEPGPSNKEPNVDTEQADKKKKKKKKKKSVKKDSVDAVVGEKDEVESKYTDDLEDVDQKIDSGSSGNNSGNSRDGTPDLDYVTGKRRAPSDALGATNGPSPKKQKLEMSTSMLQSASAEGITEDAVRRYLARKPMTATELLQKFKSKKTKISSQDMVNVIAHLLKKINPVQRMQHQKMYLFLSDK